jgi:cation diffusion facilitator CzcD-associated flavoprotein CzcO
MATQEAAIETPATSVEEFETIVIGGGQAGLAVGYYLKKGGGSFVILDANEQIGGSWRTRTWSSLRLFTPARYDGLPGWPFPAPGWSYPSARETADYLEAYAERFELPVKLGMTVDRLAKAGDRYLVESGGRRFAADRVVVATGFYGKPSVPEFASELDPRVVQMHSSDYRDPSQLRPGGVLLVGAGNSGADIAMETSATHRTWLSGPDKGQVPVRIESPLRRRAADPGQDERSAQGRRRVGTEDGRRAGRVAGARGRTRPGRRERHLVHGLSAGLQLDRRARLRGREPRPRERCRIRAGPLLRRPGLSALVHVGERGRCRAGRAAHRQAHRVAVRPPCSAARAGCSTTVKARASDE